MPCRSLRSLCTFLCSAPNGFLKNDHLQSKRLQHFYRRFSSHNPRFSLRRWFTAILFFVDVPTSAGCRSKIIFRYFRVFRRETSSFHIFQTFAITIFPFLLSRPQIFINHAPAVGFSHSFVGIALTVRPLARTTYIFVAFHRDDTFGFPFFFFFLLHVVTYFPIQFWFVPPDPRDL